MEPFDFGLRLKELRNKQHLSQSKVAARIGVTKESIYRYEHNLQVPTLDTVIRLAFLYRVSVDYLVGTEHEHALKLRSLTERQQKAIVELVESFTSEENNL